MGLQFLRENQRLFGLSAGLEDLRLIAEKVSRVGANVEFQQILKGLPVENGRIQINLDKEGRVVQVVSSYAPIEGASEEATISKAQATETAINEFLRTTAHYPSKREQQSRRRDITQVSRAELQLKEPAKVDDVFFARQERPRRAYKIFINAVRPFGIKEFVTDANSGEVLQTRNFVHNAVDGQGQVFIPNPVNSQNNNALNDNGDNNNAVTNNNPNPYFTVPLLALDAASAGPFTLRGPFVVLEDIEAPSNTPPSETTSNGFSYQRSPDTFEDVMIYYHIDRMQRYIQSLGFIDANNRRIRVDAHGLSGADNSHYIGTPAGGGFLAFGDGGIDDGEDADVIAHEYGHALHDNQAPGKYDVGLQADAMGEGFGDYWAVSTYANETQTSGHDMPCVMEWDAVPGCHRRVDENLTTDDFDNAPASPHLNGRIWSRTLFDIFNLLGKTTADRLVLQSHFNVPDGPTFLQAADAIVTADLQLFSGSHIPQLCTVFTNRKIYQAANCPTVPSPTGNQNTLVVLARFNDAGLPASPLTGAQVTTIVNGINSYLGEVTYTQATLTQQTKGWLALPGSRAQYYDQASGNMLVDLAQDVIDKILADEPAFNYANFDRILVLTNDDGSGGETRGQREWATTGPWPYTLPAAFGSKRLSVSVHRFDQIEAQLTHGMGHQFGLGDLYPHEGVTFPRPYADGWGNMAKTPAGAFNNTHFFGSDKLRPNWLAATNVRFIPRPGDGVSFDETIPLFRQEVAAGAGNLMLLQVGTTRGIGVNSCHPAAHHLVAVAHQLPLHSGRPARLPASRSPSCGGARVRRLLLPLYDGHVHGDGSRRYLPADADGHRRDSRRAVRPREHGEDRGPDARPGAVGHDEALHLPQHRARGLCRWPVPCRPGCCRRGSV